MKELPLHIFFILVIILAIPFRSYLGFSSVLRHAVQKPVLRVLSVRGLF